MNQNATRFSPFRTALLSSAIAVISTMALPGFNPAVNATLKTSPKAVIDEAWQIVNREYVDGSFNQQDWQAVRQDLLNQEYTSRDAAYTALRDALEQLEDPYTRFMDPKQYERLTNQTAGELSGVGMQLKLDEGSQTITVVSPIKNSPALKAGIQSGDQIIAIDGRPTDGMSVEKAAEKIRGAVGTEITLRIRRQSTDDFDVTLTRARIELEAVVYRLNQEGNRKVGYIRLREFNSHAAEQMQEAIEDLQQQQADGFVLDLRGNPGGLLRSSIEIARMWMDSGAIVSTIDRDGDRQEVRANNTALTELPMVILVDENSASASEIVAGAMKDNKRAVIMGTRTFGKALVQSVFSLSDGSGIAVTIAHYYTPNGTDISSKGVMPDVALKLTDKQKKELSGKPELLGTKADPYYSQALSILTAQSTGHPLAVVDEKP